MGCCGKVKNIALGYMGPRYAGTNARVRTCHSCEEHTWLSGGEYTGWLLKNGIKVLKNISQLEKLPKLPKYKRSDARTRLYCRLCKCEIPKKARVETEQCPLGKW